MSTRDRPRLSDRFRGKTGSDLMNEIKKEFEDNKKSWFADRPSSPFSSFRREGFPFENDDVFGKKSDAGIKSHLEDLAKKHPEFANDLKCPPWGGSLKDSWDKAFNVPISVTKDANRNADQQQSSSRNQAESKASSQESQQPVKVDTSSKPVPVEESLKQHGLRNTVDIVELNRDQEINQEPKRASSAPPDTAPVISQSTMNKPEQKRFTSKIEITPINPYEENSANSQSVDNNSGSLNTVNAAPDSKMASNQVREIPIQTTNSEVAGSPQMTPSRTSSGAREIPIERVQTHSPLNSPTTNRKQPQVRQIPIFVEGRKSPVMAKETAETVEHSKQFQQEQVPPKRKLDANGGCIPTSQPSNGQSQQKHQPSQEREVPVQQSSSASQSSPPPPPPSKPKDPMERIQEVKDEVDNLSDRIRQYNGKSRTDKEYLFLDEMLTRNLIKLDTIEVEGNDALRTARKDVIKNIQKSISLLESKVPTLELENKEVVDESPENSVSPVDVVNSQTNESVNQEEDTRE